MDWLKIKMNATFGDLWIKKSDVGEYHPSNIIKLYIDGESEFYTHPFSDKVKINIDIPDGFYDSRHGFEKSNKIYMNTSLQNFNWYKLSINGQTIWVRQKPIQEFDSIHYMSFFKDEIVYDFPFIGAKKQRFGEANSYDMNQTQYSYSGFDYNEEEKRFNWYSVTTDKGLKWYPSKFDLYNKEKLSDSDGFVDGIISSWNDYITSDLIQNLKSAWINGRFDNAQFEEKKLFTENEFLDIYNRNKNNYIYHYVIHQRNTGGGNTNIYIAFSNAPITTNYNGYYRTIDNSQFVWVDPFKSSNYDKPYIETIRTSITTVYENTLVDMYELNLGE